MSKIRMCANGDENNAYKQLLDKNSCLAIHQQNLKLYATEMFKVVKCSATFVFDEYLRKKSERHRRQENSTEFIAISENISYWDRKLLILGAKDKGMINFK